MTAALVLSRRLRSAFCREADEDVNWFQVRRDGVLRPDLVLRAIEFFQRGGGRDMDTVYERGRILVAAHGEIPRVRSMLNLIPGRDDVSEIRLDGDWVVCRLRHELSEVGGRERAQVRFLRKHRRRFPSGLSVDGIEYRCSYGFANWVDFIGLDPLEAAIADVQSWFDSFGQVLMPLYHPTESELKEVLVISPLGMRHEDDPWCWSGLADRLIPFLLADYSPMSSVLPRLVGRVDAMLRTIRAQAWPLPVGVRTFRRVQKQLHWTWEGDFDQVSALLGIVLECEALMESFADKFEPLMVSHGEDLLEAMESYCADARAELWRRLQADD